MALENYRATKADFADCMIGRHNRDRSCNATWTMDGGTRELTYFEQLYQVSQNNLDGNSGPARTRALQTIIAIRK